MFPSRGSSHQNPSWLLVCLLLACAGAGNNLVHRASNPGLKGVGLAHLPRKSPGDREVVTPLMRHKESELHAAGSIRPVLVGNLLCRREGEYFSARSQCCLCPLLCSAPWQGTAGPQDTHGAGAASGTLLESQAAVVCREAQGSWVTSLNSSQEKARKPNLVLLPPGQETQLGTRDAPGREGPSLEPALPQPGASAWLPRCITQLRNTPTQARSPSPGSKTLEEVKPDANCLSQVS